MLRHAFCTRPAGWALSHRTQLRCISRRGYAATTGSDDPQWFQELRTQMLQRGATHLPEHLTAPPEYKLSQTLTGFLPREFCHALGRRNLIIPFGHHLIWFNPSLPTHDLLPDGTDASHSPGGPWVRRMWAGGSVHAKPRDYFDTFRGFAAGTPMAGIEHIKHVRLHGQDDTAKIFVTIERRFARLDALQESYRALHGSLGRATGLRKIQSYLEDQLRSTDDWGNAILKEERNLVFFKERSVAEIDAIKAGQMASIKYLDPPGDPLFSHTLTPNRALLFRFSALTFNAHLIHLDPDYARNVEGHRNLLVHGPLSLTLMLQLMNNHLETHTKGAQVVESIEYRNLAPLYCDEEMRICGLEKKTLQNGSIYDLWIEGPTGGVAVKGTVYTTVRTPTSAPTPTNVSRGTPGSIESRHGNRTSGMRARLNNKNDGGKPVFRRLDLSAEKETRTENGQATGSATIPSLSAISVSEPSAQSEGEKAFKSLSNDTTSQPPFREVTASLMPIPGRVSRRRSTRLRSHQFISLPTKVAPPIRPIQPYIPAQPVISRQTKQLLRRLFREITPSVRMRPLPLARKYAASPYTGESWRDLRGNRFLREGIRRIERPRIRYEGEHLARWRWRRRLMDHH
ncbi:hypothetical protein COCMIDRAFT_39359 [Bipolaris oryzae ATCC 44560]|uniref:MaoC-like domain-containing protein n=1 Tax=Bipolaris oryzae ATCC 44560 TaxID=930090 RepID=W6YYG8_COCMI|nr:uncharacterized protein COCMIDRAFT_39359 [Bipolaris oryzae ATCC 44560]EUC42618.1 hypothetical protein COCMIDRAFT_39359 [Bipolaris oryzae ATCC 44560]